MSFGRIEVPPPKNGQRYRGVAVCRISTDKQNEMSLADQEALYRERLPDFLDGEYDLEMMSTQGSGEILDRAEYIELSEKVASGECDFVIAEDRCGICGRRYVQGGHGRKDRMMCNGARNYNCWNAMTFNRVQLANRVAAEIHRQIESLPEFDSELIRKVREESKAMAGHRDNELQRLDIERRKLQEQIDRLTTAIATGVSSPSLLKRLLATEQDLSELDDEIADVTSLLPVTPKVPTADELRRLARQSFLELAVDSREFAQVMRNIVQDFYMLPYRLIDGGNILPRAVFKLDLGSIQGIELSNHLPCMTLDCMVDLRKPNQRVDFREQVVSLRASGLKEREVAIQLGITQPIVQRASKLHRAMMHRGVSDPWQPVFTQGDATNFFKRVTHPMYRFKPLDGFTPKFPDTGV